MVQRITDAITQAITSAAKSLRVYTRSDQGLPITMVRAVAVRSLRASGYKVLEAENGDHALSVIKNRSGSIDLLVTDVVMPGMNGRELADKLLKEHLGMKVLYMSGYIDDTMLRQCASDASAAFLQKPFLRKDLLKKVRGVLDAAPPAASDTGLA